LTLFGVNTGLRGETLVGVLNQSGARLLVVDERFLPEVQRVQGQLPNIAPENILVLRTRSAASAGDQDLLECLSREVAKFGESLDSPGVDVAPETNLMVIYTSGTTGLPKGINNNHLKLLFIGLGVSNNLGLGIDDVGYACMPLFHSNAMFLGFHPAFAVCGGLAMRESFSASAFVPDVLRYGVSYWNYVGEPVHYILAAIEKEYAGDEQRILDRVAKNPDNRLRFAIGNGAAPPDIDRFARWLGLEDMLELYGSTEAAISTFRRLGDPRGSVGEITDETVKILD
jgi:fatty-acyl-CoA synthase